MSGTGPSGSAIAAANLFNVDGMVALVTGGGTGIGYMIAKALAHNGAATVYIAGRRLEVLEKASKELGPNVVPITCDVTSKDSLTKLASTIRERSGFLNLLVCNSGIGGPNIKPVTAETTLADFADANLSHSFEDYNQTFSVNCSAVWFTAMACLTLLGAGNEKGNVDQTSQVLVTSSIAAFNKKAPGGYAYGQSKAAATMAMKHLSIALPQWKIRANCIAPGLFPSEMSEPIVKMYSSDNGEIGKMPSSMIPIGRMGDEKDMAGTVLFFASRAGAYCNGVVATVDGGRLGTFPGLY